MLELASAIQQHELALSIHDSSSSSLSPTTIPHPTHLGLHRAPGWTSLSCYMTTRRLWAPSSMRTRPSGASSSCLLALGDRTSLNTRSPWGINMQIPGLLFCRIWSRTGGTGWESMNFICSPVNFFFFIFSLKLRKILHGEMRRQGKYSHSEWLGPGPVLR